MQLRALEPGDLADARALLAAGGLADAAAVAEEKLFGPAPDAPRTPAWAAVEAGALVGVAARSAGWIRLVAVHPAARRRGVGGALLGALERDAAAGRVAALRTLDQPGNYLSPGVPEDDGDTIGWLERRGYARGATNRNLAIALDGNPRVTADRLAEQVAAAAAAGYAIRRAARAERGLARWVGKRFLPAWGFEVARALEAATPTVHVARDGGGDPVAFAAVDGNNRGLGWFGPAGTLPDHRRRGLGEALLLACLLDLAAAGRPFATIAWIGPFEFYQRSAGVIGERRFLVLAKELRP